MTEDQVHMFLKAKDPMVLIQDDAEDDALYRAAAASTTGSEEPDTSCSEEHDASCSEETGSSSSEETPDDMQTAQEIMDTSTTTVTTLSEDSEEFYDCWSAVAQPAHVLPTTKKMKKTKKPTPKSQAQKPDQRVRFLADQPASHDNVIREECLDFTPPTDSSHPVLRREVQAKAEPVTLKYVMATKGEEYDSWVKSVRNEFAGFVTKEALRDATPDE
eukprot:3291119-Amphidinium_carterae.1